MQAVPVLLLSSIAVFLVLRLVPGDPASALAGENSTPERVAEIRHQLGLDAPLPQQYVAWIGDLAQGNLGTSLHNNLPVSRLLKESLPAGASLVPVPRIIEDRRMLKSPAEIAAIRRSVGVNSEAYARVLKRIRPGVRELDIAAEIEFQMKMLGAEKPAFDTIVAAGPNSALPHAHPTGHRIRENELLLIDMGASLEGYCSDMTRVIHLGQPPRRIRRMYEAVLEAQLAGVDAVRAGTTAGKVDAAARKTLKRHQLEKEFVHSTGHGLGLSISKGIIEDHRGHFTYDNKVGNTCFVIEIPLAQGKPVRKLAS